LATSKVTSKAQTTVPRAVREGLHVGPGDELEWTREGERFVVEKKKLRKGEDPLDKWVGYIKDMPGMTTDELMEELRGPALDDDLRRRKPAV
jgi:antitoxin PrlF